MNPNDLADLAADKLTLFAADLERATDSPQDLATLVQDRAELEGALTRLRDALPIGIERGAAKGELSAMDEPDLPRTADLWRAFWPPRMLRRWAAEWRAFADLEAA